MKKENMLKQALLQIHTLVEEDVYPATVHGVRFYREELYSYKRALEWVLE